jgi:superfamily II DNA or RNA helicase
MTSKYVDLKINGRLFPSWVLLNFKDYKLPQNIRIEGDDPCKRKTKLQLRKYQEFISLYLDYKSPHKEILLYHGLGSGKTATTINLMNILYNYTPYWNVFILIKASIRGDWNDEIKKWLSKDEYDKRMANIKFIHYDSPFADKNFLDSIKEADSSKKNIYIFDEAHNFINNVYNNITSQTGKRAYIIYDYIQQEKRDNNDTRIMLMTGTPAINNPFEIALIFNLLRPGIFPSSEIKFTEKYIKSNRLDPIAKNMFQRKIMGLVSYYSGSDKTLFADKNFFPVTLEMDTYQQEVYEHFEDIEDKIDRKNRNKPKGKSGKISSTYKSFTRQSCNFTFPIMNSKLTGINRPRPSNFKVSDSEIQKILEGKEDENEKKKEDEKNFVAYVDTVNLYMKELRKFFQNIKQRDDKNKKSLSKDVDVFRHKYEYNFSKFWNEYKEKSDLLKEFYSCSCKITAMIFNSFSSKGPMIMYSNYVRMEGIEVIKLYLNFFGFTSFNQKDGRDYYRYVEYHGSISMEERNRNKKYFNIPENIKGKIIRIILISPAGSEGISLMNVKQVHVLEPYWNEVRINQLIGRAIRQCSHSDLPIKERFVDVYRYIAKRKNKKQTTDENIQGLANKKDELIGSFLTTLKEVAVDCELFKNHNDENNEYRCFKFNQDSLFEKKVGPAYGYHNNNMLDNGSNSINSQNVKVKVHKIKAVRDLGEGKFSPEMEYYIDHDTGVIYDFDLEFPIGKVYFDEDGIPQMLKKGIYIISEIIPIPELSNKQN